MNFTAVLPLTDDFDSPVIITIAYILVILPLIIFIALTLFLHKDNLKKTIMHFTLKGKSPNNGNVDNTEASMRTPDIVIENATSCIE